MTPELSIIYVNWNSLDYLRESIASVYEHTHHVSFEIVVVDNASPEGGIESLLNEFAALKLIQSKGNLGFAGANNIGFKHSSGKYVLFLNPDTKLVSPSIDVLLKQLRKLTDVGILGCKLLNTDMTVQLSSIQTFPTILNQAVDAEYLRLRWPQCGLWKIGPLFSDGPGLVEVDIIPGACMLMRRDVFERVGMFSEDYFMYAEDLDLNYKVRDAGFKNYYLGSTAIVHHGGRSSSQQTVSHWATIMKYRAMIRLFRKTRGRLYAAIYRITMAAVAMTRVCLLMFMYPLSNVVWSRQSLNFALNKWTRVLRWAVAGERFAL